MVCAAQFCRGINTIAATATADQKLGACFRTFDLNGDGFVDPPEMQTGFTQLYSSMDASGDTHMDEMDIR